MTLIVLVAIVLIVALIPVVLPLLRPGRVALDRASHDRAVYRDQLRELDRDIARGLATQAEADSARLEIQRRLLVAGSVPGQPPTTSRYAPAMAAVIAVLATGGSAGLYALIGAAGIPGAPFAARSAIAGETAAAGVPQGHDDFNKVTGSLRARLQADPSNVEGWLLYARTAGSLKHWDEAVDAYRHVLALGRDDADIEAGYGETLTFQAAGIVTPSAHTAFLAALKFYPKQDVAQYYMAIAAGQAGDPKQAIDRFQGLLASIPEDSPMRDEIVNRIGEAAKAAGVPRPVPAKGTPADSADPDDAAMEQMAGLPETEQKAMINLMVARLADRLKAEPKDIGGWLRLGRAYVVLGDRDKAAAAFESAAAQKPGEIGIRLQAVSALLTGLKPDDELPGPAIAMLKQVETVAPDEPEVLWYLGISSARGGRPGEARRYWARLIAKLPPNGEDAKMVRSAMDSLNGG